MIEAGLAWIFLIAGLVSDEPIAFVASGAFAIAGQICRIADRMGGKK